MSKVDSYDIIEAYTPKELRHDVLEAIIKGWQPLGGCSVIEAMNEKGERVLLFFQTVVMHK